VQTASEQLALLTKSADDIDRITLVIQSGVRTNQLAGVKRRTRAARARGSKAEVFAVLADEVRALSGQEC